MTPFIATHVAAVALKAVAAAAARQSLRAVRCPTLLLPCGRIPAGALQQVGVAAAGNDGPTLEHQNAVAGDNCRQAM